MSKAQVNTRAATPLAPLLSRNRAWAARKLKTDPAFFRRLNGQQRPAYFWIRCSDSRVPATEIVDLDPGEMFVHRNVANLAIAGDPSFEAALSYVRAAKCPRPDQLGRWLKAPSELYRKHRLSLWQGAEAQCDDLLCELNVLDQVERLSRHPTITLAWRAGRDVLIHGWIYSIANGLIAELCDPVGSRSKDFPA